MPVPLGFLLEGYAKEARRDKGELRRPPKTPAALKEYQAAAPLSTSTPVVPDVKRKTQERGTVSQTPTRTLGYGSGEESSSGAESSEDEAEEDEESEEEEEEEGEEDDRSASDSGHAAASPPNRRVTRRSSHFAKPPPPAAVHVSSSEDSELEEPPVKRPDPVEYCKSPPHLFHRRCRLIPFLLGMSFDDGDDDGDRSMEEACEPSKKQRSRSRREREDSESNAAPSAAASPRRTKLKQAALIGKCFVLPTLALEGFRIPG